MPALRDAVVRDELERRRHRLEEAIVTLPQGSQLENLMREVDEALARVKAGVYGICESCGDAIEEERLAADPLLRRCLDHLTRDERRALEQDLDLTWRIQSALLPQADLVTGGWEASYRYQPLGTASGDCCDLVPLEGGDLFFLLGDVAGKGIAASMLMAHLQAIFRSLVSLGLPLAEVLERANRLFCDSTDAAHYATLVCGRIHGSGAIECCNAGHCPPLLLRGGEVGVVEPTGLPVGLFCASPYAVTSVQLGLGDAVLLYTDGLTEQRDAAGAEYGMTRLEQVARAHAGRSGRELVAACVGDLDRFRGGLPRVDDLTVLALRRIGA